MMDRKIELFKEGRFYAELEGIEEGVYALEWDFSDLALRKLGPKVCPVCGGSLEVDDGVLHCSSCDWVYE